MSIQERTKKFFQGAMTRFGSEVLVIDGNNVPAVINESEAGDLLGAGAKRSERELVVQFSTADYSGAIRSGQPITARGETWHVSPDPAAIKRGQAAITLVLVEPTRRSAF